MPNRTLTINNADGSSETYTINRDKFEGVRSMERGHVYPTISSESYNSTGVVFTKSDEQTFSIEASNSSDNRYVLFVTPDNGVRTGKHRITCDVDVTSGLISTLKGYYTDVDGDPEGDPYGFFDLVQGSNVIDIEIFDNGAGISPRIGLLIQTGSTFDISVTNFKITHEPDTVTVDHTPQPDVRTLTVNNEPLTIDTTPPADIRSLSINDKLIAPDYVYPTIASGSSNSEGVSFQKLPIGNPDEKTFTLVASNSTATRWVNLININNGIRTGKHRMEFDLVLNSGSISSKFAWNYSDNDADPDTGNGYGQKQFTTVGHNSFDFEIFNDGVAPNPHAYFEIAAGSTFDISVTNFKVTSLNTIAINRGESDATLTITNATDPNSITNQLQFNGDNLTFNNQPLTYNG